ncbi:MAG: DUF1959 domain-containing protein [Methanobrevibacter sp.]|jgi:energy-converting hydrogenase A subunit M|nr:DUF1959 domain-containing protein [Candidatus Methanoflexus mossambicus]
MSKEEDLLRLMKLRVLRSFRWQKDIIEPLSNEFDIEKEEFENILMGHLDMSSLENLHATFESAQHSLLLDKLNYDLKLTWFHDVLDIISKEEKDKIKLDIIKEINDGKKYDAALINGKKSLIELLKQK